MKMTVVGSNLPFDSWEKMIEHHVIQNFQLEINHFTRMDILSHIL